MASQELIWEDGGSSHLKIVLLGGRNSGKSSVGNLILGREEFVTRERTTCSRRQGLVAGRWVTVVDAPGWWCDFGTWDTAELVKREILGSVLQCFPGPHVFLVVVKARSSFSEKRRAALEQHVALLGGRAVWRHCVIVFTCADAAGLAHIMDDSVANWLTEKCGQRWHCLTLAGGGAVVARQVTQLLVKIQALAIENGNRPFEMEASSLGRLNRNIKAVEERALHRFLRMKEQRAQMQGDVPHLSEMRVVVVGAKGSGKTSLVNTILGRRKLPPGKRTARCEVHRGGGVLGRDVTVVDTPGWWMNYFASESAAFDRREMALAARGLVVPSPVHALLLVVRVDRAFGRTYRRATQEHMELLLGPRVWRHTLLVFSFGDWLGDTSVERYVESEGAALRWLVDRCGNRYHVVHNKSQGGGEGREGEVGGGGFQVAELLAKVEEMVAANGGALLHPGGGADGGAMEEQQHLEEQQQRWRAEEERRAGQRRLVKTRQRQMRRSLLENLNRVPELRLVLLGGRNAGKSSCGNTVLGRAGFRADRPTAARTEGRAQMRGVAVTVLDTPPGWPPASCDHDSGLSGLLLVVNLTSAFTSSHWEALEEQMSGGAAEDEEEEEEEARWNKAMVVFSHGDWLGDTSIEEHIECEGQALRRLVDRCDNRYHVLDNRRRGDRSQVHRLLDQIEEMLVGARLALLRRGEPIRTKSLSLAVRRSLQDRLELCQRHRKVQDGRLLCTNQPQPLDCAADTGVSCRVVARPQKARSALNIYIDMNSRTLSVVSGLRGSKVLRWTLGDLKTLMGILPDWSEIGSPRGRMDAPSNGRLSKFSPGRLVGSPLASPSAHHHQRALTRADAAANQQTRDDTLKKLFEAGDMQALIDQWGSRSLEELEAFVDAHFEMVWRRALWEQEHEATCPAPADDDDAAEAGVARASEGAEPSAVCTIAERLSKLDLLEEIQRDLAEMKSNLDKCWNIMQELLAAHRGKQRHLEEESQKCVTVILTGHLATAPDGYQFPHHQPAPHNHQHHHHHHHGQ